MLKKHVLAYYGGPTAGAKVAKALRDGGYKMTRQGVFKWPKVVPENSAQHLAEITGGEDNPLVFDPIYYKDSYDDHKA